MLTSNSIGFSTSEIMEASKKAACSLYLLRCRWGSTRAISALLMSPMGSLGSSPKIVWTSNSKRPRNATPSPFFHWLVKKLRKNFLIFLSTRPKLSSSKLVRSSEYSRGAPYMLTKHGPNVGKNPFRRKKNKFWKKLGLDFLESSAAWERFVKYHWWEKVFLRFLSGLSLACQPYHLSMFGPFFQIISRFRTNMIFFKLTQAIFFKRRLPSIN